MKLLLFAHTPPPHHGQSYMVQIMLEGFGGDHRRKHQGQTGPEPASRYGIECYHVNSRLSRRLEDIGDFRLGKFFLLIGYCLQAIWCRFRYGVTTLYYIPAPGKRSALYRDWLVMFFCRPFFKRLVLHWHAAGLAKWLETSVQLRSRIITYNLLKRVDLSLVLSRYNRADAEKLFSRNIRVVSNGIPDPCPEFSTRLLARRQARLEARRRLVAGKDAPAEAGPNPEIVYVLYLAHCTEEKGLFDTISGVLRANQRLRESRSPLKLRLLITGTFVTAEEQRRFEAILQERSASEEIVHLGFVAGARKDELFHQADLFCFPTYYQNENQPVNLLEAMAYGLPILTTRWRSLPELFPADYPGLVEIRNPDQIAAKLLSLPLQDSGERFRALFESHFTLERHLAELSKALLTLEQPIAAECALAGQHVRSI